MNALTNFIEARSGLNVSPRDACRANFDNLTLDRLNLKFWRDTLMVAAVGTEKRWSMRRQNLSLPYTTDWDSIPEGR